MTTTYSNSYNNTEWFFGYGFVEEETTMNDLVVIILKLHNEDPLKELKESWLEPFLKE